MNDRFKFRVWSYEQKRMINSWDYSSKRDFLYGALIDHRFFGNGLFITMQSTGLKDKNDRLIFESDILKELYTDDDGIKEYFSIVKWHIGSAGFVMYDVDYKIDFTYFNEFDVNLDNFEIVGNIYENSDFLNKRGKNEYCTYK